MDTGATRTGRPVPPPDTLACTKGIEVRIDRSVETVAIVFNLTGNITVGRPFDSPFRQATQEHFASFGHHSAVETARSLLSKGFWLDAMLTLPVYCSAFPQASLEADPGEAFFLRASGGQGVEAGRALIDKFLQDLNSFYREAEVDQYLTANDSLYRGVLAEVRKNLPPQRLICVMERYYRTENPGYTLIPSPLLPFSNGFGLRRMTDRGPLAFNIFGPQVSPSDKERFRFGYDAPESIDELCVHEFGHSFVNPCTESPASRDAIDKYAFLYEPLETVMRQQGYTNWWVCVTEHLVRLGEIRISYALGDPERAERIRNRHVKDRKFIYLPVLEDRIVAYESSPERYPSFKSFLPELLDTFGRVEKPSRLDILEGRLFYRLVYD
ncbi:DUF4932 domain-containing protein [bacterium]|nr:DUF4932 domain-containing protein [bacterium]